MTTSSTAAPAHTVYRSSHAGIFAPSSMSGSATGTSTWAPFGASHSEPSKFAKNMKPLMVSMTPPTAVNHDGSTHSSMKYGAAPSAVRRGAPSIPAQLMPRDMMAMPTNQSHA